MNKGRVTIHLCTKDRHSEVAVCLQSLRTQTYQNWDVIILDDASGTPLETHHPTMSLLNRIKLEKHKVKFVRNQVSSGVCGARNRLIEEDKFDNEFTLRVDDDCVYEPDYIEKLLQVIDEGYDLATGIVPLIQYASIERDETPLPICKHVLDEEGNLIVREDELSYGYLKEDIVKCHQFRTNCLYKKEITDKGIRYPDNLSFTGFREELWFSFKAMMEGYKIGAHLGAISYHIQTPSGGTRGPTYAENVQLDEHTTNEWIKKHKDKIEEVLR